MKWAFWRKDPAEAPASGRSAARRGERAIDDADPGQSDPARLLRIRARRRLIGAAALLLAAVIVVPMVLDPAPRPVPDTVPIDIPSEKTPFTPRLPLPPVPDPGQAPPESAEPAKGDDVAKKLADAKPAEAAAALPAADAKPAEKVGDKAGDKPAPKGGEKATDAPAKDAARSADAQRARELLEGKPAPAKNATDGKFFVQAAALRSDQAAAELAARLKKAGLPSFTERVQASDGTRWRVRVGPYATRQDAERARARLRELGTGADLIAP